MKSTLEVLFEIVIPKDKERYFKVLLLESWLSCMERGGER